MAVIVRFIAIDNYQRTEIVTGIVRMVASTTLLWNAHRGQTTFGFVAICPAAVSTATEKLLLFSEWDVSVKSLVIV